MIKAAMAASILSWLILIGGLTYSVLFVTNEVKTELSIMSPRTFTQVSTVYVGWLVSCVALLLTIVSLYVRGATKAFWLSLALSSFYAIPIGLLYAL